MTRDDTPRVGGILLAAGGSTRLGRPKQLVEFEGITLLRRTATSLATSMCSPRVAVLGAKAENCHHELKGIDIDVIVNTDWASGLSSSLREGLLYLMDADPRLDAVMITLCDQPYITAAIIDNFIAEYRRIRPVVIGAEYNGVTGVPALFAHDMFDEILKLDGDKGARDLIRAAGGRAVRLRVPEAAIDIDSLSDVSSLGDRSP